MSGGPGWEDTSDDHGERLEPLAAAAARDQPELTPAEVAALEAALTRALRPVELPAGFAGRVLARAAATAPSDSAKPARVLAFPGWRVALSGAVAAALVAGSLVGVNVHQGRERARARAAATAQFETATRITDATLEHAHDQLQRAGVFGE